MLKDIKLSIVNINPYNDATSERILKQAYNKDFLFVVDMFILASKYLITNYNTFVNILQYYKNKI